MKKSILNLGRALNKEAQKQIQGGKEQCDINNDCGLPNQCCHKRYCVTVGAGLDCYPYDIYL